jgi:hypothetical protein
MKTTVEWLVERIKLNSKSKENSNGGISFKIGLSKIDEIFEQAKEMEKEQIYKALCRGHSDCGVFTMTSECEQYYNETFNKSINNKG